MCKFNNLKNILDSTNTNHYKEIMNEKRLKNVHIYCKSNNLNGQISGPLIEKFIINHHLLFQT